MCVYMYIRTPCPSGGESREVFVRTYIVHTYINLIQFYILLCMLYLQKLLELNEIGFEHDPKYTGMYLLPELRKCHLCCGYCGCEQPESRE